MGTSIFATSSDGIINVCQEVENGRLKVNGNIIHLYCTTYVNWKSRHQMHLQNLFMDLNSCLNILFVSIIELVIDYQLIHNQYVIVPFHLF